jgi:hypothetical protein
VPFLEFIKLSCGFCEGSFSKRDVMTVEGLDIVAPSKILDGVRIREY